MQYLLLFFFLSKRHVLSHLQTPCDRTLFCVYPYRSTDDVAKCIAYFVSYQVLSVDLFHFPLFVHLDGATQLRDCIFLVDARRDLLERVEYKTRPRYKELGAPLGTSLMLNLRYPLMNCFNDPTTRVAAGYMLLNAVPWH